jgi:hypothetical protein
MTESGDDDHEFFDSNALKTGDTRLDMLLTMCLPFVIRFLFDAVGRFNSSGTTTTGINGG